MSKKTRIMLLSYCNMCNKEIGLRRKERVNQACYQCRTKKSQLTRIENGIKKDIENGLTEDIIFHVSKSGKKYKKYRTYCPSCKADKGYRSKCGQTTSCFQCSAEKSGVKNRGLSPPNKGLPLSNDARIKMSCTKQGISIEDFKGFITSKQQFERTLPIMKDLKIRCFIRDKHTCNICNKKGSNLNAHHLNSWKHFPEERYILDNLITLCENCHMRYHSIYGRGTSKNKQPNTKEQFLEFKESHEKK